MLLLSIVSAQSFMFSHNMNMLRGKNINAMRAPYVTMKAENTTEPLDYLENIEYDEDEDMWTMDLIIPDEELVGKIVPTGDIMKDMLKDTPETEIPETETPFPSFNEFLQKKREEQAYQMLQEFNKADEKADAIEELGEDTNLQILTNGGAIAYSKKWIYDMIKFSWDYPKFMYIDMYNMRDFGLENKTKNYLYLGYYPPDLETGKHGPYYVVALEVIAAKKELHVCNIIQNPNYMMENEKDTHRIMEFKQEISVMAANSYVFLKIERLKKGSNERYYFSWLYE
jgi:hypothetical protein